MSNYDPEIKIYYGPIDNNENRLIPAPDIAISLEYNYANDTIIGYTYIVTLTGVITSLDLRNQNSVPNNPAQNIGAVTDHMYKLRKLLTQNGRILNIVKNTDNSIILKAKGGILRSLSFDESPNNWKNYASYTASLEFHSVDFVSHTEDCDSIFLDQSTYPSGTAGIVDINKFKIKSFQDSWNITFDENEAFNRYDNLLIDNRSFNIQYTISATGKHFFDYENESTGDSKLLPAWEQAKNFVQYRLHSQVMSLINGVLKNTYNDGCTSSDDQTTINTPSNSNGLLESFDTQYKIFNETISCEASESDGSFSATYTAVVKTINSGSAIWTHTHAKHTVSKSKTHTNIGDMKTTNISINGTIQGLEEGGLIRPGVHLSLPSAGSLLIYNGSPTNKYNNAKILLDKIYNPNNYNSGIGITGKRDINNQFKTALGITLQELEVNQGPYDSIADAPHPISFNLTHDYNAGTINYSIEYSSNNNCGNKYREMNIQITQPVKVTATFDRPNSNRSSMIQELGTYTPKTVSITINGVDNSEIGQPTDIDLEDELNGANVGYNNQGYLPVELPYAGPNNIITQKQYTKNPMDGSYSVILNYICGTNGCN